MQTLLGTIMIVLTAGTAVAADEAKPSTQSRFISLTKFSKFTAQKSERAGEQVFLSPVIKAPISWNQLVVSWNLGPQADGWCKVEARGIFSDHTTKFFTVGQWSENRNNHPCLSVGGQKDSDGDVSTDTLILSRSGADVQIQITLPEGGKFQQQLKFLGLSFLDSHAKNSPLEPNRKAWGKIITTPERSQNSYPQEQGWCSATSMSMVLMRWSEVLHRPEMNLDVPEVADGVLDDNFGTGNWPFNTAFAGKFSGMRAYVSRFSDIAELEDWIVAGIPVIISAPFHLLEPGRKDTGSGHVVTVIGFTENGDVVINDPATNLAKGQKVRHIYKRENVVNAWNKSHNTVYLVYPTSAKIPKNRLGQWEGK